MAVIVEVESKERLQLMSEPKARRNNFRFGHFLIPVTELLISRRVLLVLPSDIGQASRIITAQLVIESKLRRYMFLGHLTELARSEFNTFHRLQILPKQADFGGGET
jgi:hypothetical protein